MLNVVSDRRVDWTWQVVELVLVRGTWFDLIVIDELFEVGAKVGSDAIAEIRDTARIRIHASANLSRHRSVCHVEPS